MRLAAFLNSFLLYILVFILSISYAEEFIYGNSPCPLCILQRFFLVGVGVPLMFNISGKVHFKNFVLSLLSCVLGVIVSLYQWSQLLINDGVSHAAMILGLPMYIWGALFFFGVSLILFVILIMMGEGRYMNLNLFTKVSYGLFFLMAFSQILVTFYSYGNLSF